MNVCSLRRQIFSMFRLLMVLQSLSYCSPGLIHRTREGASIESPNEKEFGLVVIGSSKSDEFVLKNNVEGFMTHINIENFSSSTFSITGGTCLSTEYLMQSEECTLAIRFIPSAALRLVRDSVQFFVTYTNHRNQFKSIQLRASGMAALPAQLQVLGGHYGDISYLRSKHDVFSIRNLGDIPATHISAFFDQPEFRIAAAPCQSLLPGQECLIDAEFSPRAPRNYNSKLNIQYKNGLGDAISSVHASGSGTIRTQLIEPKKTFGYIGYFGAGMVLSADGLKAAVGGGHDELQIWVRDSEDDSFSFSQLIEGHSVGAYYTNQYNHSFFGQALAFSADGTKLAVGAPMDFTGAGIPSGAVYLFELDGKNFKYVDKLFSKYATSYNYFGYFLKFSQDSQWLFVGAPGSQGKNNMGGMSSDVGLIHGFLKTGEKYEEINTIGPRTSLVGAMPLHFGRGFEVFNDGRLGLIVSCGNCGKIQAAGFGAGVEGRVFFYRLDQLTQKWVEVQELQSPLGPSVYGKFGTTWSSGVSVNGGLLVVGSPDIDRVFIFNLEEGMWIHSQTLVPPNPNATEQFGWAVSLSGNERLFVTSLYPNSSAGSIRMFLPQTSSSQFSYELSLPTPGINPFDNLGRNLAQTSNALAGWVFGHDMLDVTTGDLVPTGAALLYY